jgi:multicomponent Na+:H+ antiporter subunit D
MLIANTSWMIFLIVAPLLLALAAFLLGTVRTAWLGGMASVFVVTGALVVTSLVWQHGPQTYGLGGWPTPLGIRLRADGLSCVMLLMAAVVGSVISVYAMSFFNEDQSPQFWPLWLMLWSALNALFLSADIFNLYIALELITLAGVGLVIQSGTRDANEAALRYLLVALAGSLLYLAGVTVIYGAEGALDIETLSGRVTSGVPMFGALLMVMLGLMLKTALFPFHFWLPPAHGNALPPVSAVLSALVIKTSFYILLRLWFDLFPAEVTRSIALLPAILGSLAILWGSAQAIIAERLKMLVAYSTVAQVGYLFLVFGLAERDSELGFEAWSGGILFALSHALAKGSLFLAAGTIIRTAGHDRIQDLAPVARRLPVTFFAVGCASVSLMGLPPTAAFTAKWALLRVAFDCGQFALTMIIIVGGLLAAVYMFRLLTAAFDASGDDEVDAPQAVVPRVLEYTTLFLALGSLFSGLVTWPVIELLRIGAPWRVLLVEGLTP